MSLLLVINEIIIFNPATTTTPYKDSYIVVFKGIALYDIVITNYIYTRFTASANLVISDGIAI